MNEIIQGKLGQKNLSFFHKIFIINVCMAHMQQGTVVYFTMVGPCLALTCLACFKNNILFCSPVHHQLKRKHFITIYT
jgi:hypothetical protein